MLVDHPVDFRCNLFHEDQLMKLADRAFVVETELCLTVSARRLNIDNRQFKYCVEFSSRFARRRAFVGKCSVDILREMRIRKMRWNTCAMTDRFCGMDYSSYFCYNS